MPIREKAPQNESVETLVAELVAFMTQDETRFSQFLGLSGLTLGDLRERLADKGFQAMVLDHALENESWVVEFAAAHNLPPDTVIKARRKLPGFDY